MLADDAGTVTVTPQRSPPSTGGTTADDCDVDAAVFDASTEPAQYGRDDMAAPCAATCPATPQRSPPSTGGTTARSSADTFAPSVCLNGARPVRAGRRAAGRPVPGVPDAASTEPAQYGRDDTEQHHTHPPLSRWPQRSPPSTGGTTRAVRREYGVRPDRLNGARPVRAGRQVMPLVNARYPSMPQRSPPSTGGTT